MDTKRSRVRFDEDDEAAAAPQVPPTPVPATPPAVVTPAPAPAVPESEPEPAPTPVPAASPPEPPKPVVATTPPQAIKPTPPKPAKPVFAAKQPKPAGQAKPAPDRQQRPPLFRAADGRLRKDTGDHEIADIWAEQRRIQAAEALAEKRKQEALKKLRREKGLYGLGKAYFDKASSKVRTELFGTEAGKDAAPKRPSHPPKFGGQLFKRQPATGTADGKTVEIKISMPRLPAGSLSRITNQTRALLDRLPRQAVIAGGAVLLLIVAGGIFLAAGGKAQPAGKGQPGDSAKQPSDKQQPQALQAGTPAYPTVTPDGKDASQLGGWKRVSPPDKDPVYAYADKLSGVNIAVSQQPLPADFKRGTADKIAELAKNFNANKTLNVGNNTAYIGTSAKGPQSVILSQDNLLILIKSDSIIKESDWTSYIGSLRR